VSYLGFFRLNPQHDINDSTWSFSKINVLIPLQFSEDVEILNEAASQRSQSVLVAGLQRESQHMRELQAENRELRAALDDYQNAMELIMSKYRQQVAKLTADPQKDKTSQYIHDYIEVST